MWEWYLHVYATEVDWPDHLPMAKFTYNISVHTATGLPPFHVSQTYRPRIGFEPLPSIIEASKWVLMWKECLEKAQEQLIAA